MEGTICAKSNLGILLMGKNRMSILSLLLPTPNRKLYLRQIVRMTGAGQGAVQRELALLAEAGILIKTREANLTYYQANPDMPVYGELKGLVEKTGGIAGSLRSALLPLASKIERAFLFGSVGRGEERAESDIDLMVIGDVPFLDIVAVVSPLQELLGREINPTVFTAEEFQQRLEDGDSFLTRVMRDEKVDLIGVERDP